MDFLRVFGFLPQGMLFDRVGLDELGRFLTDPFSKLRKRRRSITRFYLGSFLCFLPVDL